MKKTGKQKWALLAVIMAAAVFQAGCGEQKPAEQKTDVSEFEPNIIETELVIEGLTGEYDLLLVADSHAIVSSEEDSEQESAYKAERMPMFQNEKGITSTAQLTGLLEYANEAAVDAVLFAGDIIDDPSASNLAYLNEQLTSLKMPYLYTLGNHDWTFPWEYMTETGKETYLSLLAPYMEQNPVVHKLDMGEFVIVAVDNSANQVNAEALNEYAQVLSEGKPVLVLVHVPFLTQSVLGKAKEVWSNPVVIGGGNWGGIYPDEASNAFVTMTLAADSPVEAMLAGHVHFYDEDVMEGEKNVLQIVADAGFHGSAVKIHIRGTRAQ